MRSHFSFHQGLAAACAVAGATTLVTGNCSAQNMLAADYATNAAYAGTNGWQAGQNAGFGFGPWSMDNTEATTNSFAIDSRGNNGSPFNPFGTAWVLFNPEGTTPAPTSPGGTCANGDTGTDIARAGRACPPLLPGQTFSTVIANPDTRTFFRGYTIRLVTGGDNTSYGNNGTQIAVGTFEYFTYGRWYTTESYNTGRTTLFDTDTCSNGMQLDVTMTTTNTYDLVMTPLANPSLAYSESGTLLTNGPINWVEYEIYNTDSDFYPSLAPCGPDPTDFYVKSMTISGIGLNIALEDTNVVLSWPSNTFNLVLKTAATLGAGTTWNNAQPPPTVISNVNYVTNPVILGTDQFYELTQ